MRQIVDESGKYFSYLFEQVKYTVFPSGSFHCTSPCTKHYHQFIFTWPLFSFIYWKVLNLSLIVFGTIKGILTIFYQKNLGISQRSSLWVGKMGVLTHLHGIPDLHNHYHCLAYVSAKIKVHKVLYIPQSFVYLYVVRNHKVSKELWPKSSMLFGNSVLELHTREI